MIIYYELDFETNEFKETSREETEVQESYEAVINFHNRTEKQVGLNKKDLFILKQNNDPLLEIKDNPIETEEEIIETEEPQQKPKEYLVEIND